jgi:heptaprenyl diphosphate synthase
VPANPLDSLATVQADQARIERTLMDTVRLAGDDYLTEIASHLIKAGGKRLRPAFTVVAAATALADGAVVHDDVVRGGVAVELVQVGSLYHDDVMDEAQMRRQVVSVNARWGNLRAILAGDYLLAKASEIAASLGTEVAGLLASTIARLCAGQVAELRTLYDLDRTEEQYFPSIDGKTASLFSAATRIGALVVGHDRPAIDRLTEFGRLYGMAFQIVDDILDVVATDEQLGKPAGKDMLEGVYSLPVIHTLASSAGEALRPLLREGLAEKDRRRAIEIVRNGPGIGSALAVAQDYVDAACLEVAAVSDNLAAQALADAARQLIDAVPAAQAA